MSDLITRLPEKLKTLHEGFLAQGVQGWGTARQYATVCSTHPEHVLDFLRTTDEEQQRQQRRRDAELREELDQKLGAEDRKRSARLLVARRYKEQKRQLEWQCRQHGLVAAAKSVFQEERKRKKAQREERQRRRKKRERRMKTQTPPQQQQQQQGQGQKEKQGQEQQQQHRQQKPKQQIKENVPQRVTIEASSSVTTPPWTHQRQASQSATPGLNTIAAAVPPTAAAVASAATLPQRSSQPSPPERRPHGAVEKGPTSVLSTRDPNSGDPDIAPAWYATTAVPAAPAATPISTDAGIAADVGVTGIATTTVAAFVVDAINVAVSDTALAESTSTTTSATAPATASAISAGTVSAPNAIVEVGAAISPGMGSLPEWEQSQQNQQKKREGHGLLWDLYLQCYQHRSEQQQSGSQEEECDDKREGQPVDIDGQLAQQGLEALRTWEAAVAVAKEVAAATAAAAAAGRDDGEPGASGDAGAVDHDQDGGAQEQQLLAADLSSESMEATAVSRLREDCQLEVSKAGDTDHESDGAAPPPPKRRKTSSPSGFGRSTTSVRGKAGDLREARSEECLSEPLEDPAVTVDDSFGYLLPIAEVLDLKNKVPFNIEELCAVGDYGGSESHGHGLDNSGLGGQTPLDHASSPVSVDENVVEVEGEERATNDRGRASPYAVDPHRMAPLMLVGREESQSMSAAQDDIGASSQDPRPTNPTSYGKGRTDQEPKDTVLRTMSDRQRVMLSAAVVDWREGRAKNLGSRFASVILPDDEVVEVVEKVPTTKDELRTVGTWRGSRKLANHGESLLTVVNSFLVANKVALDVEEADGVTASSPNQSVTR